MKLGCMLVWIEAVIIAFLMVSGGQGSVVPGTPLCYRCINDTEHYTIDTQMPECLDADSIYSIITGTCVKLPGVPGQKCYNGGCGAGMYCNSTNNCVLYKTLTTGEKCTSNVECFTQICNSTGYCDNLGVCTSGDECPANSFCENTMCYSTRGTGELCSNSYQCDLLNYCLNGVCVPSQYTLQNSSQDGMYCANMTYCNDGFTFCRCPLTDNLASRCDQFVFKTQNCVDLQKKYYQCALDQGCSTTNPWTTPISCIVKKCGPQYCQYTNDCQLTMCQSSASNYLCGDYLNPPKPNATSSIKRMNGASPTHSPTPIQITTILINVVVILLVISIN